MVFVSERSLEIQRMTWMRATTCKDFSAIAKEEHIYVYGS
jgi:hypothetical protein